jgi:hypothetical protein
MSNQENLKINNDLTKIIFEIDTILLNTENESVDRIGSLIVGATIAREDYNIYQEAYPELDEIAELGAELEMSHGTEAEAVLRDIKSKFSKFKSQINTI